VAVTVTVIVTRIIIIIITEALECGNTVGRKEVEFEEHVIRLDEAEAQLRIDVVPALDNKIIVIVRCIRIERGEISTARALLDHCTRSFTQV
jgi:hypothetical protein